VPSVARGINTLVACVVVGKDGNIICFDSPGLKWSATTSLRRNWIAVLLDCSDVTQMYRHLVQGSMAVN